MGRGGTAGGIERQNGWRRVADKIEPLWLASDSDSRTVGLANGSGLRTIAHSLGENSCMHATAMRKMALRAITLEVLAIFLFAAPMFSFAQSNSRRHAPADRGAYQLRFTLVLSRHGIRPPLASNASLDLISSDRWPEWPVPLGYLTPHGAVALRQMGAYMRLDAARSGLFPSGGCPGRGEVYLYSDTAERNIESTRNTFAGFEPGCAIAIHTIVPKAGARDPLFSPIPDTFPRPSREAMAADQRGVPRKDPAAFSSVAKNPELIELARILAPNPAHPPAKPILNDPSPLAAASSPIEDILLEYVDDKPMSQVGWGRVDEATLRRLIALHVKEFSAGTRTPLSARTQASNMVAHFLDTLEQAAQSSQVAGALGPVGTRLVYVSGHDSNVYRVGGLLGLHWTANGRTDAVPPDSQLVFELLQSRRSKQYFVRILYRAQTLDQLRSAEPLTLKDGPAEVSLTTPGCKAGGLCPFATFNRAVHGLLDPAYVQRTMPPTEVVGSRP